MDDRAIQFPVYQEGTISFAQLDKPTRNRLIRNETVVCSILLVTVVALVAVIVAVSALVMDQMHFNNELYRDKEYVRTDTMIQQERIIETRQPVTFPNVNAKP